MPKKLVCSYSGWFSIPTTDVNLTDPLSGKTKTAQEWLDAGVSIKDLILVSFDEAEKQSTDGEQIDLTLSIEDS